MVAECWECGKQFDYDIEREEMLRQGAIDAGHDQRLNADHISHTKFASDHIWKRAYCHDCKAVVYERKRVERQEYIKYKTLMQIEKAIVTLERQLKPLDFNEYREAIKSVSEFAQEHPEKFDGHYEMIAAIMLINQRIKIKMQHKVKNYRADICIEPLKVLLELDGSVHIGKAAYDSQRDKEIREIMGPEWEIVRIPNGYLDKTAERLVPAIIALRDAKRKARKDNFGMLPAKYSGFSRAIADEVERVMKRA